MKYVVVALLAVFSFSALAINEVECNGRNSDSDLVEFEVEQAWGGSIRDARLLIFPTPGTNPSETIYRIHNMRRQNRRWIYSGTDGLRLEVDLFPDTVPRWGRRYRGALSVSMDRIGNLSCTFPQVRP